MRWSFIKAVAKYAIAFFAIDYTYSKIIMNKVILHLLLNHEDSKSDRFSNRSL